MCDFEERVWCGWDNGPNADFDWTRTSQETSSVNTGPEFDHTYQTIAGSYLFTEASGQVKF